MKKAFNILIIDDNAVFALRLKHMLEQSIADASIDVSFSYNNAVEKLAAITPTLVLLDVRLGERSGIELLKQIRQQQMNCYVIMISNQLGDGYREQCRKLGAHLFLDKMRDLDKLPDILSVLN